MKLTALASIVATLSVLEYASALLIRRFGTRRGTLVVGFLGGLISSTAVLLSSTKRAKHAHASEQRLHTNAAVAAKTAALIEVLVILGLISPPLLVSLAPPLIASIGCGVICLLWGLKQSKLQIINSESTDSQSLEASLRFDWRSVAKLSVLLAAITTLIAYAQSEFGMSGARVMSFLTGLFELHGVSFANASLYDKGDLSLSDARENILLALGASFLAKIVLGWMVFPGAYARTLTLIFGLMIASIYAVAALSAATSYP